MEHTVDYEKWKTRAEEYEKGLLTAYAWIMEEYCTTSMRSRIEEHPDFNTTDQEQPHCAVRDNPSNVSTNCESPVSLYLHE